MRTEHICLDGRWRMFPDTDDRGVADHWPTLLCNPATDIPGLPEPRDIDIPSATQRIMGPEYHDITWLHRSVRIPNGSSVAQPIRDEGARLWLCFAAVATGITAWVNGVEVGRHAGDYVPLQFEITEAVRTAVRGAGDQEVVLDVVVRIDELPGHITKGFHDVLSVHHGGLWDSVSIVVSGALRAVPSGVSVQPVFEVAPAAASRDTAGGGPPGSPSTSTVPSYPQPKLVGLDVVVELEPAAFAGECEIHFTLRDPDGEVLIEHASDLAPGTRVVALEIPLSKAERAMIRRWWPHAPTLYTAEVELHDDYGVSDRHSIRTGFRHVRPSGHHLLLNGRPVHIRGVLHWGHEPEHLAPAPTPGQIRHEFSRLREMGFNCVCLCMWYPPAWFHEIADETGMLLWQEHPNWQAPMEDEHIPEYLRLYEAFLRRDRNHPSVVIVSATCEHPKFHPEVASWWWQRAAELLPNVARQVQTASFAWSDPEQTDLYDEHTYENSDRWVFYLEDLQEVLATMPAGEKPFIMGESILFTSWPQLEEIERLTRDRPETHWWRPGYHEPGLQLEKVLTERYGTESVPGLRWLANRFHLLGRKFQVEQFRARPNHAGVVMNHLRDVPQCTCGFLDDLGNWRFSARETSGWLADATLILFPGEVRRGLLAGAPLEGEMAVSNFGSVPIEGSLLLHLEREQSTGEHAISRTAVPLPRPVHPGEVLRVPLALPVSEIPHRRKDRPATTTVGLKSVAGTIPPVFTGDSPMHVRLHASAGRVVTEPRRTDEQAPGRGSVVDSDAAADIAAANSWDLWLVPPVSWSAEASRGACVARTAPFTDDERTPWPEEQGYSRGFGLPARKWTPTLPDPTAIAPGLPTIDLVSGRITEADPASRQVILTARLHEGLIDWMVATGGRVLLFASKARGGFRAGFEWLFGGVPLVIEQQEVGVHAWPIEQDESIAIVDLVGHDFTARSSRLIASDQHDITGFLDPIIRLIVTHNRTLPEMFDQVAVSSVGERGGLLVVSTLDHTNPAGQWFLRRLVRFAADPRSIAQRAFPLDRLRAFSFEAEAQSAQATPPEPESAPGVPSRENPAEEEDPNRF